MKVEAIVPTTQVVDILCDVCGSSTTTTIGTQEFGTLAARWGYGSQHDGAQYQVHLCETCFFEALANLRQVYRSQNMLAEDYQPSIRTRLDKLRKIMSLSNDEAIGGIIRLIKWA
ncbi:hypothetical protein D3C85_406250 [compost metagenome]